MLEPEEWAFMDWVRGHPPPLGGEGSKLYARRVWRAANVFRAERDAGIARAQGREGGTRGITAHEIARKIEGDAGVGEGIES